MTKLISIALIAFVIASAAVGAGDVLQQLGVSRVDATEGVTAAFADGAVGYHRVVNAFKDASPTVRAALTEQVLVWTKAFVASPQFAKDYAAFREMQKPEAPQKASVDEELKQRRANQAAELEESRKAIASMPAEYRKAAEDAFKETQTAMQALDTPEQRSLERDALEAERKDRQAHYDTALQQWKTRYPADARGLVKQRLREFLAATADVDFNAKLVQAGTRKRFANPEYESKSSDWKLAFRAGKETTEKARAFASTWLKELS